MVGGISLGVYHKLVLARGTVEVQGAVIGFDLGIAAVNGCGRRHAISGSGIALYGVAGVAVVTAHICQRACRADAVGKHRVVVRIKGGDGAHRAEQVVRAVNAAICCGIVFSGFDDVGVVLGSICTGKMPVVLEGHVFKRTDVGGVVGAGDGNIDGLGNGVAHAVADGDGDNFCVGFTLGKAVRAIGAGVGRLEQRVNGVVVYLVGKLVGHI